MIYIRKEYKCMGCLNYSEEIKKNGYNGFLEVLLIIMTKSYPWAGSNCGPKWGPTGGQVGTPQGTAHD